LKKYKEKEILIFQVTWKLFSNKAFHDIKISEIAKLAGIGKGTVYEYFKSKEDLVHQMIIYNLENSHEKIIQAIATIDSPEEKLRIIGKNDISRRTDILKTMRITQMINNFNKENIKNSVFEMIKKRFVMIQNIIEDGIKKDIVKTDNSINATILYIGTMNNALMVSNFSNDSIDMDDILEFVISLLIKKGS
jgi:TetR/AcrR family fatty acid metabolism transcriptional regulator